jgi:hypothetical protein
MYDIPIHKPFRMDVGDKYFLAGLLLYFSGQNHGKSKGGIEAMV